jgi:hypothetical protein
MEDRWVRSERWSEQAESYREIMDTPERIDRMRREDRRYGARVYGAIAIPVGGFLAHLLQRAFHQTGLWWFLLYLCLLVLGPQALIAALRGRRNA